jgi:hypothetical protein
MVQDASRLVVFPGVGVSEPRKNGFRLFHAEFSNFSDGRPILSRSPIVHLPKRVH